MLVSAVWIAPAVLATISMMAQRRLQRGTAGEPAGAPVDRRRLAGLRGAHASRLRRLAPLADHAPAHCRPARCCTSGSRCSSASGWALSGKLLQAVAGTAAEPSGGTGVRAVLGRSALAEHRPGRARLDLHHAAVRRRGLPVHRRDRARDPVLRRGERARGPDGPPVGAARRRATGGAAGAAEPALPLQQPQHHRGARARRQSVAPPRGSSSSSARCCAAR